MAAYAEKKYIDATLSEDPTTRRRDFDYIVIGTSDESEARSILYRDAPSTEGGLVLTGFSGLRPTTNDTWEAVVSYAPFVGGLPDPSLLEIPGQEASFQFETGGGRRTIRKNRSTGSVIVPTGATAVDANNKAWRLINATPENGVEGVEIESSVFNFSITKTFSTGELPPSYVAQVYALTNNVNTFAMTLAAGGTVLTFAGGELLFRGASGAINNDDGRWRFTYNFSAQKNETISIDGFDSFTKRGWDYLELKTIGDTITSGDYKFPVRKPTLMIVHVVYEYSDLRDLGI